jgi:lysozyme
LGKLTVGYGRLLEDKAFSQAEVDFMFETDFSWARRHAETFLVYESLNEARKGVLIEMIFQLGPGGVRKFKRFLDFALAGDYEQAHDEMLDSLWHHQTPKRCEELADIFLRGEE